MDFLDKCYELTNPQKSIYYTEQLYKGKPIASISGTVYIDEIINVDLLQKAIKMLVKENDALRTKIHIIEGEPIQSFSEYKDFQCETICVKNKKDLCTYIQKRVSKPFDIEDEYLIKALIFKYPNGKGGFNIINSHLLCDAWSETLVCNQIVDNYLELLKGSFSEKKRESYIDYIQDEKDYLSSEKYEKDELFWQNKFETLPELVSTNTNSTERLNCTANRLVYEIPEEKSNAICDYCKENKISIYAFFLTVYAIYF